MSRQVSGWQSFARNGLRRARAPILVLWKKALSILPDARVPAPEAKESPNVQPSQPRGSEGTR